MKTKFGILLLVFAACAHAETGEVRIARQRALNRGEQDPFLDVFYPPSKQEVL